MDEIKIKIQGQEYTLNNNNGKYNRAKSDAGENATSERIFAHYDKLAGLIKDENGQKVENGRFWGEENSRLQSELNNIANKSDEELEAIIRRAENTNVSGSLFQRAKIELEIRDRKRSRENHSTISEKVQISVLEKYRDEIIVGIIVTVVGGLILAWII